MYTLCLVIGAAYCVYLAVAAGNYPANRLNHKHCARLKNTINYQKPICVDNGNNGFTKESEDNCQELKETCPEFNQASCQWLNKEGLFFPNGSSPLTPIPSCRLKYYAKGHTWMEIFYTLQYGKDAPVYDIVEISRKIKNKAFGNRHQEDWPKSVIDPSGERGLQWTVATNLTEPLSIRATSDDFCVGQNDTRCSVDIVRYLSQHYPNGFDESRLPKMSLTESAEHTTVTVSLEPDCRDILVDARKARACQVIYQRRATYTAVVGGKLGTFWSRSFKTIMEFLEVQVFYKPRVNRSNELVLKYAYWSDQDPESRDEIFSIDTRNG